MEPLMTPPVPASWEVRPFDGLGPLQFGQKQASVRRLLGPPERTFAKAASADATVDGYDSLGIHAYFDTEGRLMFVEAYSPAEPRFREVHLLGGSLSDVLGRLQAAGVEGAREVDGGHFFDEFGFALYAPEANVEGVSVYQRGYY